MLEAATTAKDGRFHLSRRPESRRAIYPKPKGKAHVVFVILVQVDIARLFSNAATEGKRIEALEELFAALIADPRE